MCFSPTHLKVTLLGQAEAAEARIAGSLHTEDGLICVAILDEELGLREGGRLHHTSQHIAGWYPNL